MKERTNDQCLCMDKRRNGRQAATNRWTSLLAFGYAGLALACKVSLTKTVLCGRGKRCHPCDWPGECLWKRYPRLGLCNLHREERNRVKYMSHLIIQMVYLEEPLET